MAHPVLVALDLRKSYDGREDVLKGASLDVRAGVLRSERRRLWGECDLTG